LAYSFEYDAAADLTAAVGQDSVLQLVYDSFARLQSVSTAVAPSGPTATVSYAYDENGNVVTLGDSFGGSVEYTYDSLDRLTNAKQAGVGVIPKSIVQEYDDASFLTALHRYADSINATPVASTFYEYTCAAGCINRLTAIRHRSSSNKTLNDWFLFGTSSVILSLRVTLMASTFIPTIENGNSWQPRIQMCRFSQMNFTCTIRLATASRVI
jgi:YD repeat-containing protein